MLTAQPVTSDTDTTWSDLRSAEQNRRGQLIRRCTIWLLTVLVLLGALGAFGMRSATVHTSGGGYELSVDYAAVSRAGLDTPWQVTVRHPGGFDGPITLASRSAYFDMFETQGLVPAPDSETAAGRYRYQTFSPPPGDTFTVTYDAYIQPSSQLGHTGETALIVDGREQARVTYRTRLVP